MKLKPIIVLCLIFLALLRVELPCGCAESHNFTSTSLISTIQNSDDDLCADCGHQKHCCAHKKFAGDLNSLTASTFTIEDSPWTVAVTEHSVVGLSKINNRTIWNKAPPLIAVDSLYSLGQKLSV